MTRRLRMTFERGAEDVLGELVNYRLADVRATELTVVSSKGYVAVSRFYSADGRLEEVAYDCGLDEIVLAYEEAGEDDALDWRFGSAAYPAGERMDCDALEDDWYALHPHRVMRSLRHLSFPTADAFFWFHHERERAATGV